MRKLQPGTVLPDALPLIVPDRESTPTEEYIKENVEILKDAMRQITVFLDNATRLIDEHQGGQSFSELSTSIDVLPDFETGELIESIIIVAPPAAAVNVTLGSRHWALVIPATGFLVIAPVAIRLDQRDQRNLSCNTPGLLFMELMGHRDRK